MDQQTYAKATPTVYFVLVPDPGGASAKQGRVEVPCRFARPTDIATVRALPRSVYAKKERLPPSRQAQGRHTLAASKREPVIIASPTTTFSISVSFDF